jgi:cell division GTPase FtsZ
VKALLIGCGQGGSRLVEAIMKIQCATFGLDETNHSVKKQFEAMIVNTTAVDIRDIDKRVIHETHRLVIGGGYAPTSGRGAGGDPRLGTQAARKDLDVIECCIGDVMDTINLNPEMITVDAIIIVSALGGGSGSGMGPVIAHRIKEIYGSHFPVIGIASLPGLNEGRLSAYNASISLNSWLKENNFDGIITIALGKKSLKPSDNTSQYFARFNKSVATSLYLLFGGGTIGQGSKTVDVQDILMTIRDGGGICTLGHLSCQVADKKMGGESYIPILSVDGGQDKIAGDEVTMMLGKIDELCQSHLFLPVNVMSARAGLLVIKDSKNFIMTKETGSKTANHMQSLISGPLRFSGLDQKTFNLITDNSNGAIFNDYEVTEDDERFTRNETIELALLLSGISDVDMIRALAFEADKVFRFTRPPKGTRLLAETLGLAVGEKVDPKRLLPCSNTRDNIEALTQSKATDQVLNDFVDEIYSLNGDLIPEDKIRKWIKVSDVKPVPDLLAKCGNATDDPDTVADDSINNGYEIDLVFKNINDHTLFRKRASIIVNGYWEKGAQNSSKHLVWLPPEVTQSCRGWQEKEKKIVRDVMKSAEKELVKPVITGIGDYPHIRDLVKKHVRKVRVIIPAATKQERVTCVYYFWIDAYPDPVVFTKKQLDIIQESCDKRGYADFWDIVFDKNEEFPSKDKLKTIFEKLEIPLNGGEFDDQ